MLAPRPVVYDHHMQIAMVSFMHGGPSDSNCGVQSTAYTRATYIVLVNGMYSACCA